MVTTIIDTSDPRVIHIIYPDGMDYPKEMLDPNIGGYFGLKQAENTPENS